MPLPAAFRNGVCVAAVKGFGSGLEVGRERRWAVREEDDGDGSVDMIGRWV